MLNDLFTFVEIKLQIYCNRRDDVNHLSGINILLFNIGKCKLRFFIINFLK